MTETKEDMFKLVQEKTSWTPEEIEQQINSKITEFKGYIDRNVAIAMIAKDLNLKDTKKKETKKTKKDVEKPTEEKIEHEYPLSITDLSLEKKILYPAEAEILFAIERRKFVKRRLIDETDLAEIKRKNMPSNWHLKKSGTQKYINAFGISIEMLDEQLYETENNVIAECKVKAIAPTGQYVIAVGTKEKQEYWSEKYQDFGSFNLHNLKATARTRAIHIAVSDLVGYGELSVADLTGDDLREANK